MVLRCDYPSLVTMLMAKGDRERGGGARLESADHREDAPALHSTRGLPACELLS